MVKEQDEEEAKVQWRLDEEIRPHIEAASAASARAAKLQVLALVLHSK